MASSTVRSQVVPRQTAERGAVILLWVMAILLWLLSTFGNFVQFVGGWDYVWPLNSATLSGVFFALLYQGIFTLAQWGFKAKRWWMLYVIALMASAIPSFLTYNSWANEWIVRQAGARVPPDATSLLAGLFLFVVAVLVDLVPEWVLVE